MKIAHVTPYFHPEYYGSHEAFLSKELARRGHEVVLFTSDRMPRWGGAKGLSSDDLAVGESTWQGVRIVRIPAGPTVSFVPSLPSLPRRLAAGDWDVFLSHEVFSLAAWHTARAARKQGRPFVLVQHGYHAGRRLLFRALFELEFALLGRGVLRAADHVVSLTAKGAEFLVERGAEPAKVEVIPTGVACASFEPRPSADPSALRVGFVGRIETGKGVFDLVEAVWRANDALRKRHDRAGGHAAGVPLRVELEFVGAGADTEELERAIAMRHLGDRVRVVGRVPHAEVPGFVAGCDALCVPTREVEPFGIVAVEAAAAGVPCVATRIGGLVETVVDGETGVLVAPGDVDELTAALVGLATEPERRERMGAAARERALEVYDWPRITDRFEARFDALAARTAD